MKQSWLINQPFSFKHAHKKQTKCTAMEIMRWPNPRIFDAAAEADARRNNIDTEPSKTRVTHESNINAPCVAYAWTSNCPHTQACAVTNQPNLLIFETSGPIQTQKKILSSANEVSSDRNDTGAVSQLCLLCCWHFGVNHVSERPHLVRCTVCKK